MNDSMSPLILNKIARSEVFFHGRLLAAYERAKRLVEEALAGDLQILALLGSTRTGKTEIAQALLADYPAIMVNGGLCKPVIRVSTPPEPNKRSMALAIIRGLDGRVLNRCGTDDLYDQACKQLRVAGVKVIIFDEIQHLSENYKNQHARRAADLLKTLSDECRISLLLMGLPVAERLFGQNEQLRERSLSPELIYPYAWASPADREEFRIAVELVFEVYREAGWLIQLEADDMARRLYAACLGRFGRLIDLFSHAETDNVARVIDLKCLAKSYDHCIASKLIASNPFLPAVSISDNELNQAYAKVLREAHLDMPKF